MAGSQGDEKGLSHKDTFNIAYALVKGHAMCFLPFMRKNFGSEALGWPGAAALVIMVAVGGLGRIPEMWPFLGFWVVAMLYQRASTARAMSKGVIRHSRYEGDVDTRLIKSRATAKLVLEPLCCVAGGVAFQAVGFSHGFAVFIGAGAFSLALLAMIDRHMDQQRVQAMRDAAIEQEYLAARVRGEIDD
jgi:hypothetical protein